MPCQFCKHFSILLIVVVDVFICYSYKLAEQAAKWETAVQKATDSWIIWDSFSFSLDSRTQGRKPHFFTSFFPRAVVKDRARDQLVIYQELILMWKAVSVWFTIALDTQRHLYHSIHTLFSIWENTTKLFYSIYHSFSEPEGKGLNVLVNLLYVPTLLVFGHEYWVKIVYVQYI